MWPLSIITVATCQIAKYSGADQITEEQK